MFIQFLNKCSLPSLDLSKCDVNSKSWFEQVTVGISLKPYACKDLKVLNLAQNNLTKECAKLLSPALKENKTIEFLDLSSN